ncbi:MAG: S9 family peptidase [Gammaproteobacteria bacterium]|nr:S9 family peptidase [Gammaproteobacteria bacterium]MDH5628918.1 S9 family peptidase [Gammaproteobacteria bacterium]
MRPITFFLLVSLTISLPNQVIASENSNPVFQMSDVFELEYASDPQMSPDGKSIIYLRNDMDIMKDKKRAHLWQISVDGKSNRPLTNGDFSNSSPLFSPDGKRIAYISSKEGKSQIFVRWLDNDREFQVAQLQSGVSNLIWSPDGKWLAFTQLVADKTPALTGEAIKNMPKPPKGASWADPAKVIGKVTYRADGAGYLPQGYTHIFIVPADGGTPRQITSGDYNHASRLSWMPDNKHLVFSANRRDNWRLVVNNNEIFKINIEDGKLTQLTDRAGPDSNPSVSPDGKWIAYTGFDDKYKGFQIQQLYIMKSNGKESKSLTRLLDRTVQNHQWAGNSQAIYFQYDDHGDTKIARTDLTGTHKVLTGQVGGTSFGRPYAGGSFSVSDKGDVAFTWNTTERPAEVGFLKRTSLKLSVLTDLNGDLLNYRNLAKIEEINTKSSHDQLEIQGWLAKPADFDPKKKYPLILEIHGGPFSNYGTRFSPEVQLYAAAGYLVLYTNPRGSTSYGEKFANEIHHAYPGYDYDDLISMVDAVVAKGYVNEKQLFVTGGSGGGVLTSWIVGKTDRFAAAVVAKPVINWTSFVLTADMYPYFTRYWFEKMPWEDVEGYWKRSPLSLVGNVKTPTMLLTGEADYRTPMSETEQYYQALKLRNIDTLMVRIPDASHGITRRPSNLIAKVSYILAWFERYQQ